jgi:hypothetical protein
MKDKSILLRMSEKLKKETEFCAKIEQESTAEYVRKAVEARNKEVRMED